MLAVAPSEGAYLLNARPLGVNRTLPVVAQIHCFSMSCSQPLKRQSPSLSSQAAQRVMGKRFQACVNATEGSSFAAAAAEIVLYTRFRRSTVQASTKSLPSCMRQGCPDHELLPGQVRTLIRRADSKWDMEKACRPQLDSAHRQATGMQEGAQDSDPHARAHRQVGAGQRTWTA